MGAPLRPKRQPINLRSLEEKVLVRGEQDRLFVTTEPPKELMKHAAIVCFEVSDCVILESKDLLNRVFEDATSRLGTCSHFLQGSFIVGFT